MHHHDTAMHLATLRQGELLAGAALARNARAARTARATRLAGRRTRRRTA